MSTVGSPYRSYLFGVNIWQSDSVAILIIIFIREKLVKFILKPERDRNYSF